MAGTVCIVEVTDTNFAESFTAVPDSGWYFQKWNSGDRLLCGDSHNPDCELGFNGPVGDKAEKLVASSETFYLMPVFRQIEPDMITKEGRSVVVDGIEWLQPVDFVNYSCPEIGMACPNRVCSGTLPGNTIDLTGYRWASSDEVYQLFNVYDGLSRAILEDFEYTLAEKDESGRDVNHTLYAMLSDVIYRGCEPVVIATVYDGTPDETGMEERSIGSVPNPVSDRENDIGAWFWRAVE